MFDDLKRTIGALLKGGLSGDVASQVSISFAAPNASFPSQGLSLPVSNLFLFEVRSPKDKLAIYDSSATNRYGIGLNDSNINLFYSTFAHFSLRQNSTSGTEAFTVDGAAGNVTIIGNLTMRKRRTRTCVSIRSSNGSGGEKGSHEGTRSA